MDVREECVRPIIIMLRIKKPAVRDCHHPENQISITVVQKGAETKDPVGAEIHQETDHTEKVISNRTGIQEMAVEDQCQERVSNQIDVQETVEEDLHQEKASNRINTPVTAEEDQSLKGTTNQINLQGTAGKILFSKEITNQINMPVVATESQCLPRTTNLLSFQGKEKTRITTILYLKTMPSLQKNQKDIKPVNC
jgi:hypothetical protein